MKNVSKNTPLTEAETNDILGVDSVEDIGPISIDLLGSSLLATRVSMHGRAHGSAKDTEQAE